MIDPAKPPPPRRPGDEGSAALFAGAPGHEPGAPPLRQASAGILNGSSATYLIAIGGLTLAALMATVILQIFAPPGASGTAIGQILAMVVPTVAALLALLKGVQNGERLQQVSHSVNGNLDRTIANTRELAEARSLVQRLEEKLTNSGVLRRGGEDVVS